MGIGSFLLYLVVASKTELDKMTNLRTQMETLLLNAKEELHKNDAYPKETRGNQFSPQVISDLASSIFAGSSTSGLQEENSEHEVSKPEDRHTKDQIQRQHKLKVSHKPPFYLFYIGYEQALDVTQTIIFWVFVGQREPCTRDGDR